jgi:AbiU2
MFGKLSKAERIELAKLKMERVLDYFLYVIELHANNSFVVYSDTLTSQVPKSFAANAFLVFQRSMHQIEIVRVCALWDGADPEKENIPTVVELIDDDEIIDQLADEDSRHWKEIEGNIFIDPSDNPETIEMVRQAVKRSNQEFGDEQAAKARSQLRQAIADTRAILNSPRWASVMNVRDKHIAHSLEITRREKRGPVQPMKYGDETWLLNASIPIVEALYCWVNGKGFSIRSSQEIDQKNAEALWKGCQFSVLR